MGPISNTSQSRYDATYLLQRLRQDLGVPIFGLLVQVLFAHVLVRLGGKVQSVNNPGHPDIGVILDGKQCHIEVEVASRISLPRQLEQGDLDVLQIRGEDVCGYYCVLDCGPPMAWLCVDVASLGARASGKLRLPVLRAYSDQALSHACTMEFCKLVHKEWENLYRVSYSELRSEILQGQPR